MMRCGAIIYFTAKGAIVGDDDFVLDGDGVTCEGCLAPTRQRVAADVDTRRRVPGPNDLEDWSWTRDTPGGDPVYLLTLRREELVVIVAADGVSPQIMSVSRGRPGQQDRPPTRDQMALVKACFDVPRWAEIDRTPSAIYLMSPDGPERTG